jgi:Rrf2 family protein
MTRTAEYSLRAVAALGLQPERHLTARDLAGRTKVPPSYLAKLLRALARAGLIVSHRGPGGGFRLGRLPSQVTMLDVVNAVDPIRRTARCPLHAASRRCGLCGLHLRIDVGLSMLERLFACSTIAEVLGDRGRDKPARPAADGVDMTSATEPSAERCPAKSRPGRPSTRPADPRPAPGASASPPGPGPRRPAGVRPARTAPAPAFGKRKG